MIKRFQLPLKPLVYALWISLYFAGTAQAANEVSPNTPQEKSASGDNKAKGDTVQKADDNRKLKKSAKPKSAKGSEEKKSDRILHESTPPRAYSVCDNQPTLCGD